MGLFIVSYYKLQQKYYEENFILLLIGINGIMFHGVNYTRLLISGSVSFGMGAGDEEGGGKNKMKGGG